MATLDEILFEDGTFALIEETRTYPFTKEVNLYLAAPPFDYELLHYVGPEQLPFFRKLVHYLEEMQTP